MSFRARAGFPQTISSYLRRCADRLVRPARGLSVLFSRVPQPYCASQPGYPEDRSTVVIPQKYLVFLGDVAERLDAKTGFGLIDWRREACVGQLRLPGCKVDLGIPEMTAAEGVAAGARTLVIGVAPFGGVIAKNWIEPIAAAIDAGLNVASGMHTRLGNIGPIAEAAHRTGRSLFDVRHADRSFAVGSGRKRSGKRLLAVGTDCAVGKKYTALAIALAMQKAGMKATFRATGQTGILIAGGGVAIDAVVSDFVAGAAEWLSPDADADHWDVIEGQGSLFHPAYAAVSPVCCTAHSPMPSWCVTMRDARRSTATRNTPSRRSSAASISTCAWAASPIRRSVRRRLGEYFQTRWPAPDRYLRELEERLRGAPFDPLATGPEKLIERLQATQ